MSKYCQLLFFHSLIGFNRELLSPYCIFYMADDCWNAINHHLSSAAHNGPHKVSPSQETLQATTVTLVIILCMVVEYT